jgi:hypothetical protein
MLPTPLQIVDNGRQLLRHSWIIEVIPTVTKNQVPGCLSDCKENRQRPRYKDRERTLVDTVLANPFPAITPIRRCLT